MRTYMFVSEQDDKIVAFTSDETGDNLPSDHGAWRLSNSWSIDAVGNGAGLLAGIIKKYGYYVMTGQSERAIQLDAERGISASRILDETYHARNPTSSW